MPIRFRCAYCNQLMAIAHRKAGTVVRCPTCAGQVVVPTPEQVALQPPAGPMPMPAKKKESPPGPALFEHSDFDQVFQNPAPITERAPPAAGVEPGPAFELEPLPVAGNIIQNPMPRPRGLVLSPAMITLLSLLAVVLLGLAFLIGLLVGRAMARNEYEPNWNDLGVPGFVDPGPPAEPHDR